MLVIAEDLVEMSPVQGVPGKGSFVRAGPARIGTGDLAEQALEEGRHVVALKLLRDRSNTIALRTAEGLGLHRHGGALGSPEAGASPRK